MFYKLSNRASQVQIEEEFKTFFQYPGIYKPRQVIDGLCESTISIITSERPKTITPSIWGILPTSYSEDWQVFQKYMSTLNISDHAIDSGAWYGEPFEKRRCLILVTGFYTCFIADGQLYPFYISTASGSPFSLGGIYNQLEDGFLTTSLITVKANDSIQQIHNLSDRMPMIVPENWRKRWLDQDLPLSEVRNMLKTPLCTEFRAIPIAKRILDMEEVLENTRHPKMIADDLPMPLTLKHLLLDHDIISADTI